MKDFWLSCGHSLLERDEGGGLLVSDDFLKVYFARPELTPEDDSDAAEQALHAALLANPRRIVGAEEIAAIANPDARENWEVMLAFRDRLLRHPTVEAAYVAIVRDGTRTVPPLFLNQLVHLILRNALDGCNDAYVLRAAEMFFREQQFTVHDEALIATDEEILSGTGDVPSTPLVAMLAIPASGEIDVMNESNAARYWERSDRFDMALDLTAGRRGLAALGEVMSAWIFHMLSIEVDVEALTEVHDVDLTWYVGLDAEGTKIGEALWNDEEIDDATRARVVGIYRMTFRDPSVMTQEVRGDPVYVLLAMTADQTVRVKPQNLLSGLPVRRLETVG
jgi:hypothetical protein